MRQYRNGKGVFKGYVVTEDGVFESQEDADEVECHCFMCFCEVLITDYECSSDNGNVWFNHNGTRFKLESGHINNLITGGYLEEI